MNNQSKPDVRDFAKEEVKNTPTRTPDAVRDDDSIAHGGNSPADEEPGPYDDDGLPENARRRVPS
jgi:hypothetical protein